jgi:hypothetical protein
MAYGIILLVVFFRPEKPDELSDADDSGMKGDDNEIDVNKIDQEMFNKGLELSIETIEIKFYI